MGIEEHTENQPPEWQWKTTSRRQRWAAAWGVGWRLVIIGAFISVVLTVAAVALALIVGVPVHVSFAGDSAKTVSIDPSAVGLGFLKPPTTTLPEKLSPVAAGNCFNTSITPKNGLATSVPVDCSEPHDFEVSGVIDASVYGPHSELANDGYCLTMANAYLGRAPNVGDGLEVDWFLVARDQPDSLICVVHALTPIMRPVAGSLR